MNIFKGIKNIGFSIKLISLVVAMRDVGLEKNSVYDVISLNIDKELTSGEKFSFYLKSSKFNKVIECRCSFETTADSVSEMSHSYINYELTFEELSVDSKFKIDVHNAMVTQYQNISLKRFKGDQQKRN